MEFWKLKNLIVVLTIIAVMLSVIFLFVHNNKVSFVGKTAAYSIAVTQLPQFPQKLANPPAIVRAVYVTGYSAGTKSYLNYLTNLFKNTDVNAVVVDIKGSDGYVTYNSAAPEVKKYSLTNHAIGNIDALINFFHSQNIYVIGRIAVFEDPVYSKARPDLAIYDTDKTVDASKPVLWKDNNGLSWMDPASKDVWDYDISLAKDGFLHGFDEVNFDYVRFPSDGSANNMGFNSWDEKTPISQIIKEFFQYTRQNLAGEKISADLFGQTTTNTDDMGIGQIIENAFENFDYVSPMVYPSHYVNGFMGFDNPAEHPYEIINYSMATASNRENIFLGEQQDLAVENSLNSGNPSSPESTKLSETLPVIPMAKFRPWLQDFNMGADYNAAMVDSEIKATQDALGQDYSGFMLWNPNNIYTQDALKTEVAAPLPSAKP